MKPSRKPDIFVSYSHKDNAPFQELMAALRPLADAEGIVIFTDRDDIQGSDPFHPTIMTALRDARLFVFLTSPNSARSDYIKKYELPLAEERHREGAIRALPVLLCDVPPGDVWGWLWKMQFAGMGSGASGDDLPALALDKAPGAQRKDRIAAIVADIIHATKLAPARARPGASSEIVALRCDRDEQVEKFEQASEPRSAEPAAEVWLLPGDEEDIPGGLARRLYIEHVWRALQGEGAAAASQNTRFFRWPGPGADEGKILAKFAGALAKDEGARRVDAETAAALLRERAGMECLLGFDSQVDLRNEEDGDVEQIQNFVIALGGAVARFAEGGTERPKVYIFLSVLIPAGGGFFSRLLGGRDTRVLKKLAALRADAGPCATRLAPRLAPVGRAHVKIWYKEQIANDDAASLLLCDEIFGPAKSLPMIKVLPRLKEEHSKTQRKQP